MNHDIAKERWVVRHPGGRPGVWMPCGSGYIKIATVESPNSPRISSIQNAERHERATLIAAAPPMLEAMDGLYSHLLENMTEGDRILREDANCPICYLPQNGSFYSTNLNDHHDGCPWPALLAARAQAHGTTTP